jgi:murein lipoprotein
MKTNTVMTGHMKKIAIVSLAIMLGACSNTSAIEEDLSTLTNKIDALTTKVDNLSDEMSELKEKQNAMDASTQQAQKSAELAISDAQKANERIDNIVSSYKK